MSALSKFSTMKRPLGAVTGAVGTAGGGVDGGAAGAAAGRAGSGVRRPTDTGGIGTVGSAWTVTFGAGRGPSGGVAIVGGAVRVAHPATRQSRTALETKPLTLLLRRIAHAGWQTAQQVRWERPPARDDRRGDDRRLLAGDGRRRGAHRRGPPPPRPPPPARVRRRPGRLGAARAGRGRRE